MWKYIVAALFSAVLLTAGFFFIKAYKGGYNENQQKTILSPFIKKTEVEEKQPEIPAQQHLCAAFGAGGLWQGAGRGWPIGPAAGGDACQWHPRAGGRWR